MKNERSTAETLVAACDVDPLWLANLARALRGAIAEECRRVHGDVARNGAAPPGLLVWAKEYLPRHFNLKPSAMHTWLARELDAIDRANPRTRTGAKLNVIAPRGAAKSTLVTLAYAMRAALEGRERYIWLVSDTRAQALAHLENIKAEIRHNDRLRKEYPEAVRFRRSASQSSRQQSGLSGLGGIVRLANGVRIEAFGTGQRVRGRRHGALRPTLIVCDDLENDQLVESAHMREQSRRWFDSMLLNAGSKRTNIISLATALHRDALAVRLARTPGWRSRTFRAIERWPDNMQRWEEWEAIYADVGNPTASDMARAFYEAHRAEMDAGCDLLWPEEDDLYTLMCLRAEGGRASFEREKQGSPIDPSRCEWPESYFDEHIWFDEWPEGLCVRTMALDPSKGRDARRGDYSAVVMLGIDSAGTIYLEADLARRPTPEIVTDAVALYRRFQPQAFGVETNQFQELLAGQLAEEFQRQGVVDAQPWTIDNRVNKRVRIRRLGPLLAARRLRFKARCASTRMLVDQMRDFPAGDHDDGPDAAEMALRLAAQLLDGQRADDGLGSRLEVG